MKYLQIMNGGDSNFNNRWWKKKEELVEMDEWSEWTCTFWEGFKYILIFILFLETGWKEFYLILTFLRWFYIYCIFVCILVGLTLLVCLFLNFNVGILSSFIVFMFYVSWVSIFCQVSLYFLILSFLKAMFFSITR